MISFQVGDSFGGREILIEILSFVSALSMILGVLCHFFTPCHGGPPLGRSGLLGTWLEYLRRGRGTERRSRGRGKGGEGEGSNNHNLSRNNHHNNNYYKNGGERRKGTKEVEERERGGGS